MWLDANSICYDFARSWANRKSRRKARWKRKFARGWDKDIGVRMKTITKKILPEYFKAVKDYSKTFELRKDEDNFEVGDTIRLAEWDGKDFTGNVVIRKITYILRDCPEYGLMPGYCILGIQSETEMFMRKYRRLDAVTALESFSAKKGIKK